MQSKTSFFNKTIFRKNLTRFAPVWGVYTLCLVLGILLLYSNSGTAKEFHFANNILTELFPVLAMVNLGYGLLVAQLLFGDLYNSRMCNALHSMPLRREGWFLVNVSSGLLFSLVPTTVMAAAAIPLLLNTSVNNAWVIALYWLLGANLQYICFFGIAVFSAYCVGNRFAQAVVYGILNFGSMIACWLVDTLYTPMLYGVQTNTDAFLWFSPMARMVEDSFVYTERIYTETGIYRYGELIIGDNWWYIWVCAVVGIALMVLGLLLYRKRKLECAGDFMSVRALEPVFLIVYTLVVGAMFHMMWNLFVGEESLIFLYVGMAIGFFTGRMLLKRTIRVFSLKSLAVCGGVMIVFSLTLLLTALDIFGIQGWVPKAENVASVRICEGYNSYSIGNGVTLTEKEDIKNILFIHEQALADGDERRLESVEQVTTKDGLVTIYNTSLNVTLSYTLTDGRTVNRYYNICVQDEEGQLVKRYLSTVEAVLGFPKAELPAFAQTVDTVYIYSYISEEGSKEDWDKEMITGLLEAIAADCEAETMAQNWAFHGNDAIVVAQMEFVYPSGQGYSRAVYIEVYEDCENTVKWMQENGFETSLQFDK